jgi:UDP-3-O-[3-hydroxymyristoyl] glucosamine N-acyltransferase
MQPLPIDLSRKKGRWLVDITLQELAALVQGKVCGDGQLIIRAARTLQEAGPGEITFVESVKHAAELENSGASAAVVPAGLVSCRLPVIQVADPLSAFVTVVRQLHGRVELAVQGADPRASIHPSVVLGAGSSVHAFASIGEGTVIGSRCRLHPGVAIGRFCRLGDDVILHSNVVLYDGTVLGQRVVVHANSVLGADGFGYRQQNGRHVKVPQLGSVEIGDDVEIGACTTIDRGTFQATRVGEGTKIDNLVQIGHNCRIGKHNLFVSQMGIAGSSITGDYVVVAGQAGIVDHVNLGDKVIIGAQAGVTKDVPAGQCMLGSPATPVREQKRALMSLEKLPEIRRDVQRIKQHLGMQDADGKDRLVG